jgi:hypothetical protein
LEGLVAHQNIGFCHVNESIERRKEKPIPFYG